jgi:hypothetical protein
MASVPEWMAMAMARRCMRSERKEGRKDGAQGADAKKKGFQ